MRGHDPGMASDPPGLSDAVWPRKADITHSSSVAFEKTSLTRRPFRRTGQHRPLNTQVVDRTRQFRSARRRPEEHPAVIFVISDRSACLNQQAGCLSASPRGEDEGQRSSVPVGGKVGFRAQSAARPADGMIGRFPGRGLLAGSGRRAGGPARSWSPPRRPSPSLLRYSWQDQGGGEVTEVAYPLEPRGGGTRFTYHHTGFTGTGALLELGADLARSERPPLGGSDCKRVREGLAERVCRG